MVKGGLGGYSRGILSLKENETVYVYVGGEGSPSNLYEGSYTKEAYQMEVGHEQDIVRATDFQLLQEQEEVLHAFELEVIQTMQEQVAALTPYFMDRLVIKALAHRLIALVV